MNPIASVSAAAGDCIGRTNYLKACATALVGEQVATGTASVRIPGSVRMRLATILGNRRIQRLMQPSLTCGAVVVDVGAHIGINSIFAAQCVGAPGHVFAVEPAADNREVLQDNVRRNGLTNVTIVPVAAGRARSIREFFVRGSWSAVNSLYAVSEYATVTQIRPVSVAPMDDIVDRPADLIKIDVEGAELDVLAGMTRLLQVPHVRLVVEWHPRLQRHAGHHGDSLPLTLLDLGFSLTGAYHSYTFTIHRRDIEGLTSQLSDSGRPIDILAQRPRPHDAGATEPRLPDR